MQLIVSREAQADISDAVAYFGRISPILTVRFGVELESIYGSILATRISAALLRRFPYSVFYIVDSRAVVIIGVVHQARDEDTWKRRA
ncbi:MAG TPA: hypothetical protein VGD79_00775 [Thermoanaerobaculia bacterium]